MNVLIAFAIGLGIGVISFLIGFAGGGAFLKVTKKPWTIWPLVIAAGVGLNVLNAALNLVSMKVSSYLAAAFCVGLIASSRKASHELPQDHHSSRRVPGRALLAWPAGSNGSDVTTLSLRRLWSSKRIRTTAILLAIVLTLVAGVLVAPAVVRSSYEVQDLIRARDHKLRYRDFAGCIDRVNRTYGDPVPDAQYPAYKRDWTACQKLDPGSLEP
jgi:hypothetical protein